MACLRTAGNHGALIPDDPNQQLRWDSLELTPFFPVDEPPVSNNRYTFNVQLPSGKSGRHLIYLIGQRNWAPMVELVAALEGVENVFPVALVLR